MQANAQAYHIENPNSGIIFFILFYLLNFNILHDSYSKLLKLILIFSAKNLRH